MKRLNKESNGYVITYASIMIILVALGLSFTHQVLNDKQIANVNIDKMQQMLRSLNIDVKANEAEGMYDKLILNAYLIDKEGNKIEDTEGRSPTDPAFITDIAKNDGEGFPVFEVNVDGSVKYIIPMSGTGLWGALWGYLAIESDGNTIYGADFDHSGETPGLGAEITHTPFKIQFKGKELFKNGEFKSIAVVKPGTSAVGKDYVDGISGGTITSHGVDAMLYNSVGKYKNFLINLGSVH